MIPEIKLKAWNLEHNRWFRDDFVILNGEFWSFVKGELFCRFVIGKDVALMQYTGMKDMDGIEIYSGHVIEMAEQPLLRFEVVYSPENFAFVRRWLDRSVAITRGKGDIEHMPHGCHLLKVIGNIYENPELIANQK